MLVCGEEFLVFPLSGQIMGSFCSDPSVSPAEQNTKKRVQTTPVKHVKDGSDDQGSDDSIDNSTPAMSTVGSNSLADLLNSPSMEIYSEDQAISEFKEACTNSEDQMAMYLDEAFPKLDLLDIVWENGEGVLHLAVRNKNQRMIVYCLENGLSVSYHDRLCGVNLDECSLNEPLITLHVNHNKLTIKSSRMRRTRTTKLLYI